MSRIYGFFAVVALALVICTGGGTAQNYPLVSFGPKIEGVLSADKSTLSVYASSTSEKKYRCRADFRLRVAGQRAFDLFPCHFSISAHAARKLVCTHDAGASHFTEIDGESSICEPR